MVEHRLIERMIALIKNAAAQIQSSGKVDPLFVDAAVDFLRIYADRTHHGKEEDILFRDLGKRPLSADDGRLMKELIAARVTFPGVRAGRARPEAPHRVSFRANSHSPRPSRRFRALSRARGYALRGRALRGGDS